MHKILLIDDEEHILAAMAEYFTMLGYQVASAANEVAALALLDRERYRVVITDLRLSSRNRFEGLEILEHVQRRHPETACVVLTAYGSAEIEQRARERGARAFLQKPQPLDRVETVVAALVRRFAGATAAGAPGRASV